MTFRVAEDILLEPTAHTHTQGLLDAVNENRDHLGAFLPWVPHMRSAEDFTKYIDNCLALQAAGEDVSFVIVQAGKVLGRIGIHHINQHNEQGEIGYWLVGSATGQGIISKSCRLLISYAFKDLGLHRIVIKAATKNIQSRKIPEALGFTFEGILREAEKVNDHFLDIAVYSVLKREWQLSGPLT